MKTKPWDAADVLTSPERIAAYLDAALEDGDPALISRALGAVARARGMTEVAQRTGQSRPSLYKALGGETRPSFETILAVLDALDLKLTVQPKEAPRAA